MIIEQQSIKLTNTYNNILQGRTRMAIGLDFKMATCCLT